MLINAHPGATFLAQVVDCDDCEYPCKARENSSQYNCEEHMLEALKDGRVSIVIRWRKEIELMPKEN